MRVFVLVFVLALFSFGLFSCKKGNPIPPEQQPQISLTLEDVSCTEAWVNLTTANISLPANVELLKDNIHSETISLTSTDTILYVDSLLPNKTYILSSIIQSNNQSIKVSVPVSTMDTTSHNFNWQTWTFGGQAGSCSINDVAIINENNIWATGEIYLMDTLGQPDPKAYNLLHWDGNGWGIERVYFPAVCGSTNQTPYPTQAIYQFDDGQLWISSTGNKIVIIRGTTPIKSFCVPWSFPINKIWGKSSNDLYIGGGIGVVVHYQNGQWSKLETGTDLDICDIWGNYNESKMEYEINLIAARHFQSPDRKIFTIQNNSVKELSTLNIRDGSIDGIWFQSKLKYYVVGNGIYTKNHIDDQSNWEDSLISLTLKYCYAIRGSSLNNIFICGSYGESLHFNGKTWKTFSDVPGFYGTEFYNVAIRENLVVLVGQRYNSGFIAIGKSN